MYLKEIIDECGKKIRRASWPIGIIIDRNNNRGLNIKDLLADDWQVIEDKKTWWEPKFDETYWSVKPWSGAVRTCYNDPKVDELAKSMGLCFQTEEQAKFMVEKLKVIHELEKFAYENNDEEIISHFKTLLKAKYFLRIEIRSKKLEVVSSPTHEYLPFHIYFDSEEIAKKAIETIGEDRIKKYYFGVKENGRK